MKLSKEFIAMFRKEAKKAQWEINCWNGKSIDDLVVDYLERKELKPEDFKGVVVLTIDEAKAVNEAIEWLCSTLEDYEREHDNTPALIEGWNQMDFLEHRIEQAEK